MKKFKFISLILILVVLVLVGAVCEKEEEKKGKEEGLAVPFQGKKQVKQITNNKIRELNSKVSGDGKTIVFWWDTNKDNYFDSLVVSDAEGKESKTIKIQGGVLVEKSGIYVDSLDISRNGNKVAFVGTPFVENWWSVNPMPQYVYVLDLATEKAVKIDPQGLPEIVYPETADAERAEAYRVALSDDGSKIAFTCDVWGVDFGEIHNAWGEDIDNMLIVANSDGTGLNVLELGIHVAHVDMDSQGRIFYAKTKGKKFILSVVNSDGSGKKELGYNISYSGFFGVSVSKDGRVASILRDEGVVFVSDAQGNMLAKGDYSGPVVITGDGKRVLGYQTSNKKKKEERGLVFYKVDDNLSVEQALEQGAYEIHSPFFHVNDSGGVITASIYDKEDNDEEILTITWK